MLTTFGATTLRPLRDLVEIRPERPETVLTLENAVTDRIGTIRAFELPPSVKRHFETVLDAFTERRGRGFWVQSEYGGGKTHFIAALTALLGASPGTDDLTTRVWESVNDEDVRGRAHEFGGRRVLPVAISCKGIMPIDGQYSRALLGLLMEGIGNALEAFGLADSIPVTADQEVLTHFLGRPDDLRASIDAWCAQRFGSSVTALYEMEGAGPAARAYRSWFRDVVGGEPEVDQKIVDWLTSLCGRLEGEGFDGLLVVIDEFATLQRLATAPSDVAAYEDILESLGWLVPQRLLQRENNRFGVYTIVASQQGNPTKLDQRFSSLLLLSSNAARDYEIIVSRRVRTLRSDRLMEIDQYYHRYRLAFETYGNMDLSRFREVFPLQPRVFDAIWGITASGGEVASARFGIAAVWDTLKHEGILDETRLLTVSDLLRSEEFQNDLKATNTYRDAYAAYLAARQAIPSLGFATMDADIAQRVLDALFVDHLVHHRTRHWLTLQEVAEGVLITSPTPVIQPADQVLGILSRLRQLPQVKFQPSEGARFEPAAATGPSPAEVFGRKRGEIDDSDPRLVDAWQALLHETTPQPGLWSELKLDSPRLTKVLHDRVNYSGMVELRNGPGNVTSSIDLSYASGRHFHIVVLTAPETVTPDDLADPRVAVVVPGELTPDEVALLKTYVAARLILDNGSLTSGPDGPPLRAHVDQQLKESVQRLVGRQHQVYRRGQIVSKTGVAFNPDVVFQASPWNEAVASIADRVLGAAYDRLEDTLRTYQFRGTSRLDPTVDTGKIFYGLIGESTQSADTGAAQNFGPALGLSRQMFPTQLSLDPQQPAIASILQRIASAGAAGVATDTIYEEFCGVPRGVPHEVVTLWLLACVREGKAGSDKRRIEIQLQKNARARFKKPHQQPNNRLTFLNVKDLDWSSSLRSDFLVIQASEEVAFGAVVEYAKVFDPTLKTPNGPDAEVAEEARLQAAVLNARAAAESVHRSLTGLASALNQALPVEVTSTLDRLESAMTIEGEYQRTQLLAQLRQSFPNAAELNAAWTRAGSWTRVAERSADLASQAQFLANLVSRLGTNPGRYATVLAKASVEVLPRFTLPELIASPSTVDSILQAAGSVRGAYENEYRLHHRDYFLATSNLRESLPDLRRQARILELLNQLRCAGPVRFPDPENRVSGLENHLAVCPFASESEIVVGSGAACQHPGCTLPGLDPLAQPPRRDVEALRRDISDAIRDRVNAVKARAVLSVLEQSAAPGIGTFLGAIQAGQFEGLLEVLDERLIALIDEVLDAAKVRTVPVGAIARVTQRYPTIQRTQIGEVLDALRGELERAFADAERENPDATVQLQLSLERLP